MTEKDIGLQVSAGELLNSILESAIKEGASDIHFEPTADLLRVRFRVDGRLRDKLERPFYEAEQILNRIKVLSDLELVSKPTPQDGRFELVEAISAKKAEQKSVFRKSLSDIFSKNAEDFANEPPPPPLENQSGERVVNLRVSIFPTVHGEAAVLRILNREDMIMTLEKFELNEEAKLKLKDLITKSHGMLLVTGPSGSGKTSMLYSILVELRSSEKNIVTLEDPVEYALEGIRQCQVRSEQGLSFAAGMKSILRQDPDVIMIGEIRDPETAEHAIRASLAGREVFSTVHSNSSVGILARLLDMGIERSLIAYALNGAVSKRLVRRTCSKCKITYSPAPNQLEYFGLDPKREYFKGKGCDECGGTGYRGRMGIFEIMEIDNEMRSLIMEKVPMNRLQEYVEKTGGLKTLRYDAAAKILSGDITAEEAMTAV